MLEIPESLTLAKQLVKTVKGKTIRFAQAGRTHHAFAWYCGDPADYPKLLVGRTIQGACAVGGMTEIDAGDGRIVLNDGVNMRYHTSLCTVPAKHQLLIEFTDDSALVCVVQMYGGMSAFKAGTFDNPYYKLAAAKPSPVTDAFDKDYFMKIREATPSKLSAKAFLATEQRIPGLGNGVLQDILFNARINPKRKMESLSDAEYGDLFGAVRSTLRMMADQCGRDTEKDLFGEPGGYKTLMSKNTLGKPCPVCGHPVEKAAYLGGAVYFCADCQKL